MTNSSRRFRLGLGTAGLLAIFACVHCGDGADSSNPGVAGESSGGVGGDESNSPIGGALTEAGSGGAESGGAEAGGAAAGAAAIVPEGEHYGFVFDTVTMPANNTQAREAGFDLNGDDVVDNQLGMVFATFASQGFDDNAALDTRIQSGEVILLADLQTSSFSDASAVGLNTFYGTNPDPEACVADDDCGHHLNGTARFDVADDSPAGETCVGSIEASAFNGAGGTLPIRLVLGGATLDLTLHAARVELLGVSEDGFSDGRVGGLISAADIESQLYPGLHAGVLASIAKDCTGSPPPQCGCTQASTGATSVALFDLERDCDVTLQEIKENSLFVSLLAPDVDEDGDGEGDALSVGFRISAKPATFNLP